jgi:hypothetical protein
MAGRSSTLKAIDRLTSTVEDFCAWIDTLPASETRAQKWGPREVLAHLVYWHEHYIAASRALLAGRLFALPGGRFADMNAKAAAKFKSTPIPRLTKRFRLDNRRLCQLASGPHAAKIAFSIKQGSKRWRLLALIPAVEAHIRNHLRTIKKASKDT